MSRPSDSPPAPTPEPERLPVRRLLLVAAVTLFIFTLGCLWVYGEVVVRRRALGGVLPPPAQTGRAEIGIVNQRPFELTPFAQEKRAAHKQRLATYGWVDREHQLIHIPIERAMDLVAPP